MYRVLLSIALVGVCLSLPLTSSRSRQRVASEDPDIVDSYGGGYSYFQQQDIDMRPTGSRKVDIPFEDLQDYSESSAFEQPIKPIQRTFQQNTYPSNQMYYPSQQQQQQQQQRTYSPQINFGNQQIRNQQRPSFNTPSMYSQYQTQSYAPAPRQTIYANGW